MTGFVYTFEHVRNGEVIDTFTEHNLVPIEGRNHILNVVLNQGTQVPTWYVGIYEGNYTPTDTVTAATLNSLATECTAYSSGTRPEYVEAGPSSSTVTNAASKAEFTMTDVKTIYGCFLSSVATKGTSTGVLLSIVRFGTAKSVVAGDVLRITAPISLT